MTLDKIAEIRIPNLKNGSKILQREISIDWENGQQWCVTGPSGGGKTSLLKAIAGLFFVSGSKITFPSLEKMKQKSENGFMISDKISFVPQEVKVPSGFLPDLYYQRRYHSTEQDDIPTVREILIKTSIDEGMSVDEVSKLMTLDKLLDQPFVQLSNGQTRRLMIAVALLRKPEILILDNPYTGLDHKARHSLNRHIETLIYNGVHIMIAAHEHELINMSFITNQLTLQPIIEGNNSGEALLPSFYKSVSSTASESDDNIIMMKNIAVRYGDKEVLNVPLWEVNTNQRWVIRGSNGSGKSTLLSLIVADHPQAYSNDVRIFGRKRGAGESIWEVKRRMGYFSSELLRYFSLQPTSLQVIASGWNDIVGQTDSYIPSERSSLVYDFASWLGISSLLDIRFGSLSFSQQKMVLIARAMIRNPEVLILDEPLQGMDIDWREHFKTKIDEFSSNRTILYVTHDDEEVPLGKWQVLNLDALA